MILDPLDFTAKAGHSYPKTEEQSEKVPALLIFQLALDLLGHISFA